MIEKVNPAHPDKIADRIAGALVDYSDKCLDIRLLFFRFRVMYTLPQGKPGKKHRRIRP